MSKKRTQRRLWFVVAGLTLGLALFTLWQRNLLRHVIAEVSNTLWCDRRCDHELVHSTLSVQLAWQFKGDQILNNLPSIGDDGTIYFASGQMIYALDPEMGRTMWAKWLGPWSEPHLIVPYADKVLLTHRNDSVLSSVRANDGSLVWEVALKDLVLARVGDPLAIQVLYDSERLYVVVSLRRGTQVLAFDPSTGRVLWKAPAALAEQMGVPRAAFLDKEHIIVLQPDIVTLDKNTG